MSIALIKEELYFTLLVTSAAKTLLSISNNGINPITLSKQTGNHLNMDIINTFNISPPSLPTAANSPARRALPRTRCWDGDPGRVSTAHTQT
jgi:hypothetical protein